MSLHIRSGEKAAIAPRVLLPGDPLRAKFMADNFLESPVCYNEIRSMYGFTGKWKGVPVSIQGTGMGMPSHSIYVHELINFHGARSLIRVGTCGALQETVDIRDTIMALGASTDSAMIAKRFHGMYFAPTANWELAARAAQAAKDMNLDLKIGNVFTTDTFYDENPEDWRVWAKYGVLAVEMEAAALYTIAARFGVKALCILTVSDSLVTNIQTTAEDREKSFTQMVELALDTIIKVDI